MIMSIQFVNSLVWSENPITNWSGEARFVIGFFLEPEMLDFLLCPDFDAVDTKILLILHEIQKVYGSVSQKDVATSMGVSTATIERRMSRLKDLGAVDVEKTGTRRRKYDIPLLILSEAKDLTKTDVRENYPLAGEGISSPSSQVCLGSITNIKKGTDNDLDVSSSSSDVYGTILAMMENFPEEEPMKFSGPQGKIADAITAASERTKKVHNQVREKRIAHQKANADLSPESFSTDRATRYEEYKAKHPSEYNQKDFRFLFEDKWKESGWKSRPVRWTGKNAGQLKDMIKDQGSELIAEYFEYVFDHWTELKKRFALNSSYPVIEVIYAFRKQWIPELVDGVVEGRKNQIHDLDEVNNYTEEDFKRLSSYSASSEDVEVDSSFQEDTKFNENPGVEDVVIDESDTLIREKPKSLGSAKKNEDEVKDISKVREERRRRFYRKQKVYGF